MKTINTGQPLGNLLVAASGMHFTGYLLVAASEMHFTGYLLVAASRMHFLQKFSVCTVLLLQFFKYNAQIR